MIDPIRVKQAVEVLILYFYCNCICTSFLVGGMVRIDVQAEGAYTKQDSLVVSYRSVSDSAPGFR